VANRKQRRGAGEKFFPTKDRPRKGRFDFCEAMKRLCTDITHRVDVLGHIDMERVAVAFSQTRVATKHGLYASLTPLRFEAGSFETVKGGRRYRLPPVIDARGVELLYILRFYLPRFLELEFREKLITVVHELWHVNPNFDGDIRRFQGRCHVHTGSQKNYDRQMGVIVDAYLALKPPEELYAFLHLSSRQLHQVSGTIVGRRITQPKLIPV